MTALQPTPPVTAADRLGLTLFFAIVVHAVIILGITFKPELIRPPQEAHPPIEIILVHQRSEEAPEKAEFLAQANSEGGGNTQEKARPTSPASTPIPPERPGHSTAVTPPAAPPRQTAPSRSATLTLDQSRRKRPNEEQVQQEQEMPLTAAELMRRSMEIANLSAEIDRSLQAYAQRLKHRYISSRAREYRDAAYLDAWRAKVERIGNLNYPEEAKRRGISGSLILDVAIRADGSIHSITVLRPSGKKVLDDAAVRIVRLAAPFAPFPEELRKDTDVLHITRTWQFLNDSLQAR